MTDNNLSLICEMEFTDSQTGTKFKARLGPPIFDQTRNQHYCLTEIIGLDEGGRQRIYGDSGFEALMLALLRFRIMFSKQTGDLRSPSGSAPHAYFPKEIPWVYGSDVYKRLCKMVDDEVQKIDEERTRRRDGENRREDE